MTAHLKDQTLLNGKLATYRCSTTSLQNRCITMISASCQDTLWQTSAIIPLVIVCDFQPTVSL